jgi:purine-binding chemotaxis protein CheW
MKYLTVALANQICGIELDRVREWLGYMPFTPLASADPATIGKFDHQGKSIPVIDLRMRFALPVTRTGWTSIVLVEVFGQMFALVVDNVLGLRDTLLPAGMNDKPFTPIDLSACMIAPRSDLKNAA